MSYKDTMFEEYMEYKKKASKAKTKKIEADSGRYDDRQVYVKSAKKKDFPDELSSIRRYFVWCFIDAMSDPACPELARIYIFLVDYVEREIDKYRPIAEVMYDDELEQNYQVLVKEFFEGESDDFVDTTLLEGEENGKLEEGSSTS